jgi:UDPglucose 6-dehydrogenase
MNIGFIGLGKLGLPCALAINDKGHNVWGYDIDENVKNILQTKTIPYIENGAEELLQNHSIVPYMVL